MNQYKQITIGIDPGSSSGAICVISDGILSISGMDRKTEHDMSKVFYNALLSKGMGGQILAVIEAVNSMPGQGVASSFKFGRNYGFLRGCLVSHAIPFRGFHPKIWQKHYSLTKKKNEIDKVWKVRLLNIAQNLYPGADIPLYAADAVLLAHFGKDLIINPQSYGNSTDGEQD